MPGPRKSCERCRLRKAKCVWPENSTTSCTRCQQDDEPCQLPPRHAHSSSRREANASVTNSSVLMSVLKESRAATVDNATGGGLASATFDQRLRRLEDGILRLADASSIPANRTDHGSGIDEATRPGRMASRGIEMPGLDPPHVEAHRIYSLKANRSKYGGSHAGSRTLSTFGLSPVPDVQPVATHPVAIDTSHLPTGKPLPRCYLPATDEGVSLLTEFLHDFNSKIPLLSPMIIVNHVKDCYSGAADKLPESWVLTYITFGIAHRMRATSMFGSSEDSAMADFYMNKCLWKLADLLLGEPTLQLVQCLLGVAILLQTSDRSQRAASFASIAMRMVQDLAYNDESSAADEDRDQCRTKRYTFWIAFFLDTDLAFAKMRPSSQRLADIRTPLPNTHDQDWWGLASSSDTGGDWSINVFSLHASLALIQAEMLEEVFSVKARQRTSSQTFSAYRAVVSKLAAWRRSNVLPSLDATELSQSTYRSDMVHLVVLEAMYFRTLFHLHASHTLGNFTTSIDVLSTEALHSLSLTGLPACVEDAQRFLALVGLIPDSVTPLTWITTRATLAALFTVLSFGVRSLATEGGLLISSADASSYMAILSALESAAEQSNDVGLARSTEHCRRVYMQGGIS
ncbi:uncharacterized protein LTR77_003910 [Saxophila tyrrhenica]|uniref:Zn(2)-C6 fungal-type domain-containing protein n=1 Tax=Saxophila tyrrhenica TaxID=1690608 RepID=A0AAV9PJ09_9PEZI|nr:hypothetical protein LTR77_003910 [Saxophila tyrrhenica]